MKIVFATANAHKLREAAEIMGLDYEVVSQAAVGVVEEAEENGATLEENSAIKARFLHSRIGGRLVCFADDTGLEVDALDGAPGVLSARYAGGEGHDSEANMAKLLKELSGKGEGVDRKARFRTVVTLITGGEEHIFEGVLDGSIAEIRSGNGGFGYDPVFVPDGCGGRTLADLSEEEKNAISHRGRALRKMTEWLKANSSALKRV